MFHHKIVRTRPAMFKISFPCNLAEVRSAVEGIHDFLAKEGWGAEDLMSFNLALVEACNNAIQYAPAANRAQPVTVEVVSDPAQVEFRVRDHTAGFDWPEKIQLPSPDSENGRGLYLIRTLMDESNYFRGREENVLLLRKARSATSGRADRN